MLGDKETFHGRADEDMRYIVWRRVESTPLTEAVGKFNRQATPELRIFSGEP
jgi:hypothetical protein